MNLVAMRDALVAHLDAGWNTTYPGIPVYYENTTSVDLDQVGPAFLRCIIRITSSQQVSVGELPLTRVRGRVDLRVFVKVEAGTRGTLAYMDYLTELFKYGSFSGVKTGAPEPTPGQSQGNWYTLGLSVPFWSDV